MGCCCLKVKASFRPEFVNRVDEFVVFEALKLNEIREIVRLQAKRVADRLKDKKITLDLADSAVEYLAVRLCAQSALCYLVKNACFSSDM